MSGFTETLQYSSSTATSSVRFLIISSLFLLPAFRALLQIVVRQRRRSHDVTEACVLQRDAERRHGGDGHQEVAHVPQVPDRNRATVSSLHQQRRCPTQCNADKTE